MPIIDPGHGGKDPGGGSNSFWKEKDMALTISLYQYDRLKQLNVPVELTRYDDRGLEPSERCRIIRDSGFKECISNHLNAGGGNGAETIASIHSDKRLAQSIIDCLREAGQVIRPTPIIQKCYPGNASKDHYFLQRDTGKVEAVHVEYEFADSPAGGVDRILKHWREYAEAVVKGYCLYAGHAYTAPDKGVEEMADKPLQLEDWQWEQLYKNMGKAWNAGKYTDWGWMVKIENHSLTVDELVWLNNHMLVSSL